MNDKLIRSVISRLLLEFQVHLQSEQFNRVLVLAERMLEEKKEFGRSRSQSSAEWVREWREATNWEGTYAILSEIEEKDLKDLVKELTIVVRGLQPYSKSHIPLFQKAFELIPAAPNVIIREVATLLRAYSDLKITDKKLKISSVSSNKTDTDSESVASETKGGPLEAYKLSDINTLAAYFSNFAHDVHKKSPSLGLVKLYNHGMLTNLDYDVAGHRELIEASKDSDGVADALISLYTQTDIFSETSLFSPSVSPIIQRESPSVIKDQFYFFKYLFNQIVGTKQLSTSCDNVLKAPRIFNFSANQVFANFNALMRHEQRDALLGFFKALNKETLNSLFSGQNAQVNYNAVITSPEQYYVAVDRINASGSLDLHTEQPRNY